MFNYEYDYDEDEILSEENEDGRYVTFNIPSYELTPEEQLSQFYSEMEGEGLAREEAESDRIMEQKWAVLAEEAERDLAIYEKENPGGIAAIENEIAKQYEDNENNDEPPF